MKEKLKKLNEVMQVELHDILQFWINYCVDEKYGGFYGQIDEDNRANTSAEKGSVLNSRILWTFSSAFLQSGKQKYLEIAHRAFHYINDYFIDNTFGGVYWSVDYKGKPFNTKKQIYAQAFTIYGLSEYFKCCDNAEAKQLAISLFYYIEKYSFDLLYTGYIDAFSREWDNLGDIRLSSKDANEKKTMNTHLHIMEAYTNLYRIWPDKSLKEKIILLIDNFLTHIIDSHNNHLILFFDEAWNPKSNTISFGHDIEAAWLILEAAEAIQELPLINEARKIALKIATSASEGLDKDGGIWYEKEGTNWIKEKHWWPQAEAMVGFMNAYQLSGSNTFLNYVYSTWQFIKKYIKSSGGEWWWGIRDDYSVMKSEDKAGIWKCPYHNSRACLEIMRRTKDLDSELCIEIG